MRRKIIIRFVIVVLVLSGMFFVLRSPASSDKGSSSDESMECACKKQNDEGKMIWEDLSHQFFSSF
jgi:hypothetical protein